MLGEGIPVFCGHPWRDATIRCYQESPYLKVRDTIAEIGTLSQRLMCMPECDSAQQKEAILLLAQCIDQLPRLQKKILAMYYFENLPLAEIASCLGLSKLRTCQILIETSAKLFLADPGIPHLKDRQKVTPEQQVEPSGRKI